MDLLELAILLYSLSYALANTEIVNFEARESAFADLQFTRFWPTLKPTSPTLQWNLTASQAGFATEDICPNLVKWLPESSESSKLCPHELWVVLDLEDHGPWKKFNKFTLRLSWPAFFPTDVSMKIYDPISLVALDDRPRSPPSQAFTRRKYARIRLSFSGVLSPPASLVRDEVPIFLILEPLYFGVLPSSMIPVVWAIVGILALGIPVAMKLDSILQKLARDQKSASKLD